MKLVIPPNPDNLPYLQIEFVDGALRLQWIRKEEKANLDPHSYDAFFDMTTGEWSILTETRERRGSPGSFPLGPIRWEFAVELLLHGGEFVYPPSTGDTYATVSQIQSAFGKPPEERQKRKGPKPNSRNKKKRRTTTKSKFWFEVERKPVYRIRLNPARSFCIITNDNLDGLSYAIDTEQPT